MELNLANELRKSRCFGFIVSSQVRSHSFIIMMEFSICHIDLADLATLNKNECREVNIEIAEGGR